MSTLEVDVDIAFRMFDEEFERVAVERDDIDSVAAKRFLLFRRFFVSPTKQELEYA